MAPIDVLRKEVKQYINKADEKSLRMVKAVLEIRMEEDGEDWWDELPDEVLASVELSLKESEQGGGVPHEEMVEKYRKWFKK